MRILYTNRKDAKLLEELEVPNCLRIVRDSYPVERLQQFVNGPCRDVEVREIYFDGIDKVTDEVIFAISALSSQPIKKLSFSGCIEVTDIGLKTLTAFTTLETLTLDGCNRITEHGLWKLNSLENLKNLSIIGCNVAFIPLDEQKIKIDSEGCPLIKRVKETVAEDLKNTYKLMILADETFSYCLSDFLRSGEMSKQTVVNCEGWNMQFSARIKLPDLSQYNFNILELHTQNVNYAPVMSEKAIYMAALDIDNVDQSRLNELFTIVNSVQGVMNDGQLIVVLVFSDKGSETNGLRSASDLSKSVIETVNDQDKALVKAYEEELQGDTKWSVDRVEDEVCHRDLVEQRRLSVTRHLIEKNRDRNNLTVLTLNVDTKWVTVHHPATLTQRQQKTGENRGVLKIKELRITLDAKRQKIVDEIEQFLSDWMAKWEEAASKLQSINKSDVSEIKSFAKPPQLVCSTMECVLILFGHKDTSWKEAKKLLADSAFLSKMLNYDKDAVVGNDKMIKRLKPYMEDPNLTVENIQKVSRAATVFMHWAKAIYEYAVDGQEILPKRKMIEEIDTQLSTFEQEISANKEIGLQGEGQAILSQVLEHCVEMLNEQCVERRDGRLYVSEEFNNVSKSVRQMKDDRILMLDKFMRKSSCHLPKRTVTNMLEKLNTLGEVLFYPNLEGQPLITDTSWVLTCFKRIGILCCNKEFWNGTNIRSLDSEVPVFNHRILTEKALSDVSLEKSTLIINLLRHYGVLIDFHRNLHTTNKPSEGEFSLIPFAGLKFYLLLTAQNRMKFPSFNFRKEFWPDMETETYNKTDVQLTYLYVFNVGMAPALKAQIFKECVQVAEVKHIAPFAVIMSHGAAEVHIKHSVHATLICNIIDIQVRCTKFENEPGQNTLYKIQDYLWSILSVYLTIVDSIIHQYKYFPVTTRISCVGACALRGFPHQFPVSSIRKELGFRLHCPRCDENEQPTLDEFRILTGRQRLLPYHDFYGRSGGKVSKIRLSPYSLLCGEKEDPNMVYWRCAHCKISKVAVNRLWEMESSIKPTSASACFEKNIGNTLAYIKGNHLGVLSLGKNNNHNTETYRSVFTLGEPLYLCGIMWCEFLVTQPGDIKLVVVTDLQYLKQSILEDKHFENKACCLVYDFMRGSLKRIKPGKSAEVALDQSDSYKVARGDIVSVRVIREKLFEGTSPILTVELQKNGDIIDEVDLPHHRCYMALVMDQILMNSQGELEEKKSVEVNVGQSSQTPIVAEVIAACPMYPGVTAEHFPLGAALLYRAEMSSQWTLGQVLGISNDQLVVGQSSEALTNPSACTVVNIQDTLPLNWYTQGISVMHMSEILKNQSQMEDYIFKHNAVPAAFGLFPHLHEQKTSLTFLGLSMHEPKFCTTNVNSPQVLDLNHRMIMQREGKSRVLSNFPAIIILPHDMNLMHLMNPSRQLVQNWNNQALHLLCRGVGWATQDEFLRDIHFREAAAVPFSATDVTENVLRGGLLTEDIMVNIYFLLQKKYFLPDDIIKYLPTLMHNPLTSQNWDKVRQIPAGETDVFVVPHEEVTERIREFLGIYYHTLILLQRCIKHKVLSYRPKKMKDVKSQLNKVMPLVREGFGDMIPEMKEGKGSKGKSKKSEHRCPSHVELRTKIKLRDFDEKLLMEENIKKYINCMGYLMLSHINLSEHFALILKSFPNLQGLNLQDCSLESLEGISGCRNLSRVLLPLNNLTSIHKDLLSLKGTLENLDISGNPITEFPSFFTQLTKLKVLLAGNTLIKELPDDFGNLEKLETLGFKYTLIHKLPDSVSKLRFLDYIGIQGVPYPFTYGQHHHNIMSQEQWMSWCGNYMAFRTLTDQEKVAMFTRSDLSSDGSINTQEEREALNDEVFKHFKRFEPTEDDVGGFPSQLYRLKSLRCLTLSYTAMTYIPDQISKLFKLQKVTLTHNPLLETISGGLGKPSLKVLAVEGCPFLKTPPREIINQGMKTLIAYMKRLSQGSVACYRTKLMFVGLGGAGKTSLMRALMNPNHKAPQVQGEQITDGIDISTWTINRPEVNLTYSVWDFAGQTIYYHTHQFFLSNRAVYLLVWNTRLGYEHSGLDFWLSSIACHCPKAPIFIVGTHADQITQVDIPTEEIRKRFTNISGFATVSSYTGQGIAALMNNLVEATLEQPYIGERVPEAWITLERFVLGRRSGSSLLQYSNVSQMAQSAGIYGSEIKQVVYFLHELGTLQYFDKELLRDRVVVNPQWIVDVMACLVSVHNKVVKDGRLLHKDVPVIWKEYPKELHEWLLRLTEVFDLTFPLENQKINIVPSLLPQGEPQYVWPVAKEGDDNKESKMVYRFEYLPAGLFNRAQVRLYQFSDSSAMWKIGSVLKKNDHMALLKQVSDTEVIVKVFGQRPDNILLMVHEVFESLIDEFYQGVKYEYVLPCADCIKVETKEPAMFSSKVLRRAIEMKALFLQCHAFFHTLSITEIQGAMPPQSSTDYDLQLQNTVRELQDLQEDMLCDVFFLFCEKNIPLQTDGDRLIDPKRIKDDLETKHSFSCYYINNMASKSVEELAISMRNSKVILVLVSNEFVKDPQCQRMLNYAKDSLKKEILVLMVGKGREWQQSNIGMTLSEKVYINFQRIEQYEDKLVELSRRLKELTTGQQDQGLSDPDVFISYAWVNSASAIKAKQATEKVGSLGHGDPREIKNFLEKNGISCWLDVERVGRRGLYEEISEGIKKSKVVVACLSDEYALSTNCQMEFRFAHIGVRKPIVVAVVGTGFMWESTEIGMLSLGYPKTNFQVANDIAYNQLKQHLKERIECTRDENIIERPITPADNNQKQMAFKELYELAQRKFLRQISGYTENKDPYPRLFVADLNYLPEEDILILEDETDTAVEIEIAETKQENGDGFRLDDLRDGQFCIKLLCEHERGWHAGSERYPVNLSGEDLVKLWKLSAPYMGRIVAILKHSEINLQIIHSDDGAKLIEILDQAMQKVGVDVHLDIEPIYAALREYIMSKDISGSKGGLKRCYMPSGKVLWLCEEHQKKSRVTVLEEDDWEAPEFTAEPSAQEYALLEKLKAISEGAADKADAEETATVSRPTSAAADAKRNSIANAVTNRGDSANLTGQSPAVYSADAPKQAASHTSRQIRRRQGSTSRPMSQEEKLELAGRNAASAMGSGDRTSRACSIL